MNTCLSPGSSLCHLDASICTAPSSIYGTGGSAVAYVPNLSSTSTVVCNATRLSTVPHKVARWPWRRSSVTKKPQSHHATVAPTMEIKINLLACQSVMTKEAPKVNSCCCQKLNHPGSMRVDIWQARPDGTFASIAGALHRDANECRTRVIVPPSAQSVVVTTVAPGSTGALYGLGPKGWDVLPYGPPVIHMLVQPASEDANGTFSIAPTLVDIPLVIQSGTLQPGRFYGSDVRGGAWVKQSRKHPPYNITSWKAVPKENHIVIEMDIFLSQRSSIGTRRRAPSLFHQLASSASKLLPFSRGEKDSRRSPSTASEASLLCPSYLYGWPHSFFREPIAVCAPSMLDYFDL
jgi:hypothetical protein